MRPFDVKCRFVAQSPAMSIDRADCVVSVFAETEDEAKVKARDFAAKLDMFKGMAFIAANIHRPKKGARHVTHPL